MRQFSLNIFTLGIFAIVGPIRSIQSQVPSSKPTFEVASIKPNTGVGGSFLGTQPGGRFIATGIPLQMLLREAYRVRDFQILGGPNWVNSDRWDVEGKAAEGSVTPLAGRPDPNRAGPVELMLQSLIENRFQLRFHREMRDLPVYELTIAKGGLKMKLSADQSPVQASGDNRPPLPGQLRRGQMRMGRGELEASARPLSDFIFFLSQQLDRALINKTDLKGLYDVKLQWSPGLGGTGLAGGLGPGTPPPLPTDQPELFTALQEQLGLKLESARGPVEVLIIDSVQKPAEN
jgi:uncharacterized protein (TIGR03435 family)